MLAALPVCNIGLEAILSRECFPDLVILIKYATFDRNRVTIFAFKCGRIPPPPTSTLPPLSLETFWILMQKKGEKNKELNWVAPFSISLVSLLLHSPYSFFLFFFFFPPDEFYDIFLPFPPHLSLFPSSLSLTPRQFSPDRFHSVLEGMDLIALWGLVGCAGLGCLISVPCRDWFNASWSWNCLIVQPSGDSLCLRRPAGLAKHCSRLLLYAA